MDDMQLQLDVLEMLEQSVDASINAQIRGELEKKGDEYAIAMMDLLAEYGISGRKALEFIYKFDTLSKMYGNKKTDEGVGEI